MTTDHMTLSDDQRQARSSLLGQLGIALPYLLSLYIVYILLYYLPFKFAPDSFLFQTLEDWAGFEWVEPYFRYLTGGVEAVTCLLLLLPGLQVAGAALTVATMGAAIALHLFTPLGIDPYGDGGVLFKEACTNLVLGAVILWIRRRELLPLLRFLLVDPRQRR